MRGWVANRFYYQIAIPIKDAAVLSNCPDREVRRGWVQRILDHDGVGSGDEGGIEAWLRLGEAVGLTRDEVADPAPRAAGRALRRRCLRQLRAPRALAGSGVLVAHRAVRARDPQGSGWRPGPSTTRGSTPRGYAYFRNRVSRGAPRRRARRWRSRWTTSRTRAQQERALEILQFKLDVLWAMQRRDGSSPTGSVTARTEPMALSDDAASSRSERRFRLQWEPAQDCHVLLYPEGMVKLNQSAGEILKRVRRHAQPCATIVAGPRAAFAGRGPAAATSLDFRRDGGQHAMAGWDRRDHGEHPPGPPLWLLAELTYRCPLHCVFCYNPVDFAQHGDGARHRRLAARAARGARARRRAARLLGRRAAGARRPRGARRRGAAPGLLHQPAHLGRRADRSSASRRSRTPGSTTSSCRSRTRRAR